MGKPTGFIEYLRELPLDRGAIERIKDWKEFHLHMEEEKLKNQGARRAVPGHGPTGVDWPSASRDLERYLGTLLRETRQAIAKGVDIGQAAKTVALSERHQWTLFDDYNGHNVTRAYKELEWD